MEVKAWSGHLHLDRATAKWIQTRRGGRGETAHADVLEAVRIKAHHLEAYLKRMGMELPEGAVRPVVIFSSERLETHYPTQSDSKTMNREEGNS